MKIVFFGGGEFANIILHRLLEVHQVLLVVSPPPRCAGRQQKLKLPPPAESAKVLQLPLRHEVDAEMLRQLSPDVLVVCDYGQLLSAALLSVCERGALNVHPSLLPRWRGAAPITQALLSGDQQSGVTIMQMNAKMDAGDILAQEKTSLTENINGGELHQLLASRGAELLLQVLARQEDFLPTPQPTDGITYAKKLTTADRALSFDESAQWNCRRVRAFAPSPGAYCTLAGERVKVYSATVVDASAEAGVLLAAEDEIIIACGEGALRLEVLQREGRRALAAADWLRGMPLRQFIGQPIAIGGIGK